MNEVFNVQENKNYKLRSGIHLPSRSMHTAHFGIDTISSSRPNLRKLMSGKVSSQSQE